MQEKSLTTESTPESSCVSFSGEEHPTREAVARGFARAMDKFEESLGAEREGGLGLVIDQNRCGRAEGGAGEAASGLGGVPVAGGVLYRTIVRGLGWAGYARGEVTALSLCARKPLLAGIVRPRSGVDNCRGGEPIACLDNGSMNGVRQIEGSASVSPRSQSAPVPCAEIQIWNYSTKQTLVSYQFRRDPLCQENLGGTLGEGDAGAGTRGIDVDESYCGKGGSPTPVAISLHPSGDAIAVGFPHYVNVFYIVSAEGSAEDAAADDVNPPPSTTPLSTSVSSFESVVTSSSTARASPFATLRSDQREFLTKGMFSVAGEEHPIINYDPVSAVHYSPGGHLLAVVTGKVRVQLREHRRFGIPLWKYFISEVAFHVATARGAPDSYVLSCSLRLQSAFL